MNLEDTLLKISTTSRRAPVVMSHVVLGYPTLSESLEIVEVMEQSGVKIIELQLPFSDPIADGNTIMYANSIALSNGVTPKRCLKAFANLYKRVQLPLLAMTYYNIPFTYRGGLQGFCKEAHNAGVQGIIVPDIPLEEVGDRFFHHTLSNGITPIPIVSPITPKDRLKKIAKEHKKGFVYCLSRTGTTGASKTLPPGLSKYLHEVRKTFSLPLSLGFGISTPAQIRSLKNLVEIAIVGSATIDLIKNTRKKERLKAVAHFMCSLTKA